MARNCKASNALCTLVKREKEKFSGHGENCQRNVTDLAVPGRRAGHRQGPTTERWLRGTNS